MWFEIAAQRGDKEGIAYRDRLRRQVTVAERDKARDRAIAFKPKSVLATPAPRPGG
jgi:hypothetical protein